MNDELMSALFGDLGGQTQAFALAALKLRDACDNDSDVTFTANEARQIGRWLAHASSEAEG